MRQTVLIEQATMMNMLGRELMDMLDPTQDKDANTAIFLWGGRNRQVPKFPKNEDEVAMWRLRFRAHLDGMGLVYTLDHAVTLVSVKGNQRDLISRYGEQPVQQAQAAWACLLDATAGAAFEERVLSALTVRDAWCQILNWTGPSSEAKTSAIFPITSRSRSASGSTLFFSGAETWSILSAPPGPPARRATSNSGRHQG